MKTVLSLERSYAWPTASLNRFYVVSAFALSYVENIFMILYQRNSESRRQITECCVPLETYEWFGEPRFGGDVIPRDGRLTQIP